MNSEELKQIFQQKFDYHIFSRKIVHDLFGNNDVAKEPELLDTSAEGDQSYYIGRMTDADERELGFFYTHMAPGCDVRRKRVGLRKLISPYLKYDVDAAIAVFDDGQFWRLSYICDLQGSTTSAKRYSYVMGDVHGQYKTPVERLTKLQQRDITLSSIFEAFSVDALSDDFFKEYHQHYDMIVGSLAGHSFSATMHDYVKKMMGRIVFLHFLQKKGWLCGDPNFMQNTFLQSQRKDDYLESVLEPLFFGMLNTPPEEREQAFRDNGWDIKLLHQWQPANHNSTSPISHYQSKGIPYLNGGLFERDEIDQLTIKLLSWVFESLFNFLASYNFTVDENDPDDAEIGVDPEMLGKIFESLLEDNKAKGAFYTPKEIVWYMCREALIAYLDSKITDLDDSLNVSERHYPNNPAQENRRFSQCGAQDNGDDSVSETRHIHTDIRSFVEHHEFPDTLAPYRKDLDRALREVKICDPAIGSGAFPMGLLNELWRCREALSISNGECEMGNCGKDGSISRLQLKREIIENNVYGVDIEKGAIDIARLRFWLSIVVDSEEPEPLPNFDYKFMQGNSLIESFEGVDLSKIFTAPKEGEQFALVFDGENEALELLKSSIQKYFRNSNHKQKATMRATINEAVKTFIHCKSIDNQELHRRLEEIDCSANQEFFLWHIWFKDIFDKGGFDIVIGNPPYGAKYSDKCKRYFKNNFFTAKTITGKQKGSLDTFTLFIEHGYNILKTKGNLAYIVPIALTSSDALSGVHRILLDKCDNIHISSYAVRPKPVFERAVVNTSILLFTKTEQRCHHVFSTKMHRRNDDKFNLQFLVDHLQFTDVKDYMLFGRIPKIGTEIEKRILDKIFKQNKLKTLFKYNGYPIVYRFAGGRYFKVVTNYSNGSSAERCLYFSDQKLANSVGCILSSNLSFWFYQIFSDNLNWKSYEIENFTIPNLSESDLNHLNKLYDRYLKDIERNANIRESTGTSSYNVDSFKEYKIVRSKSIIDEIDDYIGPLYGLTEEEINFIKNYELEFRMAGE